ncbi:interleukin-8b.1 precursor [Danio rerio]|uniref:Chemokine (C-X-C motif) ligand 8b, duplicate 1 n=1 Tax=Danio rerio TaxID=7955 RepID=N0GW19_DANRE|nr:interleukin-8b.1 precursor [Danio rerio]CCQ71734.1 interleukin-8, like 1 [Danio rerio]|eukprot:NP_001314914.1 chemokine (C-X-C motif) ligand 8b, duplicate 1 precursor [Danio rerio]
MMKLSVSAFMLLICTTALLCANEGEALPPPQRCQCIKTHSKPPIPKRQVLGLKVTPAGSHCRNEEIIATLKKGQICLNPTETWVISLKEKFAASATKLAATAAPAQTTTTFSTIMTTN